jgi:hypothetical protein
MEERVGKKQAAATACGGTRVEEDLETAEETCEHGIERLLEDARISYIGSYVTLPPFCTPPASALTLFDEMPHRIVLNHLSPVGGPSE